MKILKNDLNKIAGLWLILAITALAVAGLFSLPPVILRGPFFADILPVEHIFSTALVIHVDLSVLVWMCAIGGVLWTLIGDKKYYGIYKTAFIVTALGTSIMVLSPFIETSIPLKNNYVPMLHNISFVIGISFFACGILLQCLLTAMSFKNAKKDYLSLATFSAGLITLTAMICFVISSYKIPDPEALSAHDFYEALFWGGGHVLQFTFTTLMLIAWLWLAQNLKANIKLGNKALSILLLANLVFVLPTPFILLFNELDETRIIFTRHMEYFGGISALIIGAFVFFSLLKTKVPKGINPSVKSCVILSILLFGAGGIIAFLISGINVIIPAHYHGSIVGISLAFMGLVYYLLPKLGFGEIKGKASVIQPYIYGIGQFFHITGLAWMGGYGALRKAPGTSQGVDTMLGKMLFFSGGALAITGGLLFVIVAIRALYKRKLPRPTP